MQKMDLSPAKWIWINSKRTLPNTFALFRKTFLIYKKIQKARCCITADSRYLLTINGKRISYGPVPCDPRTLEVDCIDVMDTFVFGENVIGLPSRLEV